MSVKQVTVRIVEGVPLFMTKFQADNFPTLPLDDFPRFCGAGKGFWEKIVPDHILWLYCSVACWIHDGMFCLLNPEKENWFIANGVLLLNIFMLIIVRGSNWLVVPRCMIAVPYFWAVMTGTGWRCFTNRTWIKDYNPYEDGDLLGIFAEVDVNLTLKDAHV